MQIHFDKRCFNCLQATLAVLGFVIVWEQINLYVYLTFIQNNEKNFRLLESS